MCKMYYVSYETAKKVLNLFPEDENDDRITLMFCNQLVKTAIEELGVDEQTKSKYIEKIVLKVFNTAKEIHKNHSTIQDVSEVFDALKESVLVL